MSIEVADSNYQELLEEYKDVFQVLGCLLGVHEMKLKENTQPVFHACRKVPFKIRNEVEKEIDRMESQHVIEKIDEPTDKGLPGSQGSKETNPEGTF